MVQAASVHGYYNVLANVAYLKQYVFLNQATCALGSVLCTTWKSQDLLVSMPCFDGASTEGERACRLQAGHARLITRVVCYAFVCDMCELGEPRADRLNHPVQVPDLALRGRRLVLTQQTARPTGSANHQRHERGRRDDRCQRGGSHLKHQRGPRRFFECDSYFHGVQRCGYFHGVQRSGYFHGVHRRGHRHVRSADFKWDC